MDWIELHNVEFGDCTVLGGHGQMLMVDCGSLNSILGKGACKFEDYARRLAKRYAPIEKRERYGMISHFHKDHVNGFSAILQENPLFFQRIYLPPAPQDHNGNPLLLEFALLVYTFVTEKSDYSDLVDNIVTAFSRCEVCPVRKVLLFYVRVTNFNWMILLMRCFGQSKQNIRTRVFL